MHNAALHGGAPSDVAVLANAIADATVLGEDEGGQRRRQAPRCLLRPDRCWTRSRESEQKRISLTTEPVMTTTKCLLFAALLSTAAAASFAQTPAKPEASKAPATAAAPAL